MMLGGFVLAHVRRDISHPFHSSQPAFKLSASHSARSFKLYVSTSSASVAAGMTVSWRSVSWRSITRFGPIDTSFVALMRFTNWQRSFYETFANK
jgi:hypothetical protein